MMGTGGSLGAWGSLVLLGLCSWTGARAAAPSPGRNLTAEARTPSSITLQWQTPRGLDRRHHTPWGLWTGRDGGTEAPRTTDASFTVDGLGPRSPHESSVWVQQDETNSSKQTLQNSTGPYPVRNLKVEAQTTSSVTLIWEEPDDPDFQNYTYRIQWTGGEIQNTTSTSFVVGGLQAGSLYEFAVWAEKNGVASSPTICNATTVPNAVTSLSVQKQTNSSITLSWTAPPDPDHPLYTYGVSWVKESASAISIRNTTDTGIILTELEAGSLYTITVWAERNEVSSDNRTLTGATVPNAVTSLSVQKQTNSSITLSWTAPPDPDHPLYTYGVSWVKESASAISIRNTTDTGIILTELEAGSLYTITVWAERNEVSSDNRTLTGATVPNAVTSLSVQKQTNSSITLSWTAPPDPDHPLYTYGVSWVKESASAISIRNTTDTGIILTELEAGSLYTITVWAERNEVSSDNRTLTGATVPNAVTSLSVQKQTNSSITLSWTAPPDPDHPLYTYGVSWVKESASAISIRNTTDTGIILTELEAGSLYTITVWAERNEVSSDNRTLTGATVPNAVTSLSVQKQTNSSITLSWTAPPDPDHPLYTYGVSWVKESASAISIRNTTDTGIILTELEAGSLYTITVWAERNEVSSDNRTLTGATAPNTVMDLHKENQTSNSIILRWKVPTDPHSQLYTYWVQWTPGGHPQGQQDPQGHQTNHTGRTNDSWYEVQTLEPGTLYTFSVWADRNNVTGYVQSLLASTAPSPVAITSCISTSGGHGVILTWSCPVGGYEAFELQVGGQRDCQNVSSCGRGVSVWDLQPAQSYPATVTTIWDGMRAPSAPVTCHTENAGVIAGAVVGVVLFLVLVGLLIFFLKKRHKKRQRKPAPKALGSSLLENIPAQDFAAHVRKNEKDANGGFAVEYQRLALEGTKQSQMVASALENSAKNRYRNVLPYDWSRVSLKPHQEEPGSDYINASFIPGLWGPREFIAAQGPLPQTVADFWRLVWEQQSRTLVMLTNCVESGRVKCEYYWPLDAQPCTYGHLQVALEGEKVLENWTVRDLRVRHIQEQKTLRVRQFHYMTWPDHGVPHSPDPLLAFWKMVRQWLDQTVEGGPPIVHCSAGVGRTGTFIALDVLLRQLERERFVGAFSYVRKMRESRPLMLQTEAQYVFLHQCILRGLQQSPLAPAEKGASYVNPLYENV
ncbi:receptor-type tyrosine-protein phosphatase H [Lynx rufus]|uniref:receptor-type tyrosine-protein phosphatase H n=1 Tax=Lynx rufus TaxID=61384 RepID=UPI001F1249BE|nr:receptor-type tyrosine-protein phosphatase H [Lynx rufus]